MDLQLFSNSKEYGFETIPKHLKFFKKKEFIQKKIALISQENYLLFSENDKILWVILEEDKKYWMPFEKSAFFYQLFNCDQECVIFSHVDEFFRHSYYAMHSGFLICYTDDYQRAVQELKLISKKEIHNFGIGDVEIECKKKITEQEFIASFSHLNDNSDEDFLLNESLDPDPYSNFSKIINETFVKWFENNHKKRSTLQTRLLSFFLIGALFFFLLGFYFYRNCADFKVQIEQLKQSHNQNI
jgi:hypothetical protein